MEQIIELIDRHDVNRVNMFRWEIFKAGGRMGFLQSSKRARYAINWFAIHTRKATDMYKIAWTILMTINTTKWAQLHKNWQNEKEIIRILDTHLKSRREVGGGDLWDFINSRRTSAQLASGMVLRDWDSDTIRAWFVNQDEISRTYRG